MHPLSQQLADGWKRHFYSADRDITWLSSEEERELWLDADTVLLSRIDAIGITSDGEKFFGEWKSMSANRARRIDEEKAKWRTDPQALTYGVQMANEASRFMVRWAIKTTPPTYDFAWYSYSQLEIDHWRTQLLSIADDIRVNRVRLPNGPWRTNFGNCFRYGIKYACPFYDSCSSQDWNRTIGPPRLPHLDKETIYDPRVALTPNLVVLGASRVADYLECPESYRRKWEGPGFNETNEALTIGTDFHESVGSYISQMTLDKH